MEFITCSKVNRKKSSLRVSSGSYANDYGESSPYPNFSVFRRTVLDYINAPIAWEIKTGQGVGLFMSKINIYKNFQ